MILWDLLHTLTPHIDTLAEGLTENRSCPRNQVFTHICKKCSTQGFSAAASNYSTRQEMSSLFRKLRGGEAGMNKLTSWQVEYLDIINVFGLIKVPLLR